MEYISARNNRIIRQYAGGTYCVTDRGNKVLYKCNTIPQAEDYIDKHPEGMSITHGSWQQELWDQLKAGITVTPLQHGTAAQNVKSARFYLRSWGNLVKRIETAGYSVEQVGEGSYRLVRNEAAN